jgi:hypothetical protein
MADGRYYGRGDKTNYQMSHAEVLRRHQQLVDEQQDILVGLRERHASLTRDVIAGGVGFMLLRAKPLGAPPSMLKQLASQSGWQSVLGELVRDAAIEAHQQFAPNFAAPQQARRTGGVALTTGIPDDQTFTGGPQQAEIVAYESANSLLHPAGQWRRRRAESRWSLNG